ncbi:MAG: hypothetical protein KAR35_10025, partial [Candidatus Heimdallarchaeota archaeon]|nr:hypothetical protein [Candidatus Heimdallarchaeota archaeon]MCK5049693.1 hypothetical protein [Candidatus Heimdallarchaeota archaeon]
MNLTFADVSTITSKELNSEQKESEYNDKNQQKKDQLEKESCSEKEYPTEQYAIRPVKEQDYDLLLRCTVALISNHHVRIAIRNDLIKVEDGIAIEDEIARKFLRKIRFFDASIGLTSKQRMKRVFQRKRRGGKTTKPLPDSVRAVNIQNRIILATRSINDFYYTMMKIDPRMIDLLLSWIFSVEEDDDIVTIMVSADSDLGYLMYILSNAYAKTAQNYHGSVITTCKGVEGNAVIYNVSMAAAKVFAFFLRSYIDEEQKRKAMIAEQAIQDLVREDPIWKVVEQNIEIASIDGTPITEIDILIENSRDPGYFLLVEVKDYSFWKHWIHGGGITSRKEYYEKAAEKLLTKEQYIKETHEYHTIEKVIVSSIPEIWDRVDDIEIIEMMRFREYLKAKRKGKSARAYFKRANWLQAGNADVELPVDAYHRLITLLEGEKKLSRMYERLKELETEHQKTLKELDNAKEQRYQANEEVKEIRCKLKPLKEDREELNIQVHEINEIPEKKKTPFWADKRAYVLSKARAKHQEYLIIQEEETEKRKEAETEHQIVCELNAAEAELEWEIRSIKKEGFMLRTS